MQLCAGSKIVTSRVLVVCCLLSVNSQHPYNYTKIEILLISGVIMQFNFFDFFWIILLLVSFQPVLQKRRLEAQLCNCRNCSKANCLNLIGKTDKINPITALTGEQDFPCQTSCCPV